MRMTPEEFHTWSLHLQLTSETEALIGSIRSSRPIRRVSGRANNVTGRYPSPKMQCSIQFESERVEFWAIYGMERDGDVLEFYDQPSRIPLSYCAKSGRKTTQWHTPDFFVLRRASAGWEEWKPAQSLETLIDSMPARYQQTGTGQWCCPPGEVYAKQPRLSYRLRSSAEYHPWIPNASMQLLEAHLQTHYAAPQAKSATAVYRLYRQACGQQGLPPVSERTFYRVRARFTTTDVTAARGGRHAAYAAQPFSWLDQTTPRHGERPFALAHLDHTELDIELISSVTGKPLGKPWATFLTDANTRRILACYVTYDPPSYRSVMMAFRECVKRHQRLPQECFVDRGPEFGSVYFETLLTRHFVTKKDRPASHPRMGSVVERLFGTATT